MGLQHPGRVLRWVFRAPNYLYDNDLGWLLSRRVCRITHVGRKSGRTYHTVLEVVARNPDTGEVTVASGFGPTADWYRNIKASKTAKVDIGRQHFSARTRELTVDEAAAVIADYEHRNRFMAPVVRYGFSKLVGWRYDSSDVSRRKLVTEIPLILLTPSKGPYRRRQATIVRS